MVALKRAVCCFGIRANKSPRDGGHHLLGTGVFGDGLGAFRQGVLGQLSGQKQMDGRLDLPGRDGRAFVVVGQTGGLSVDALENVAALRRHRRSRRFPPQHLGRLAAQEDRQARQGLNLLFRLVF